MIIFFIVLFPLPHLLPLCSDFCSISVLIRVFLKRIRENQYCCVWSGLTFDLHCHCLAGRCHSSLRSHNPCDPYPTRPSRDHCHSSTHVTGLFFPHVFTPPTQRWSSWLREITERMLCYIADAHLYLISNRASEACDTCLLKD